MDGRRRTAVALAGVGVLLVGVRLGMAAHLRGTFFATRYETMDNLANSLIHGHGFSISGKPYVEELPIYPLLVAAAYEVGGRNWASVAVMQTLLDLLTMVFLFALGRRLFGPAVGLLAAAMFAAYPYLASQSAQLIDTTAFTTALTAFFYCTVRAAQTRRSLDAAFAGLAVGAAYLVRPTVSILALALPLSFALLGAGRREIVRLTAVAAAVGVIVLVPWTVRNAIQFHAFQPGAAKTGTNVWKGNSKHGAQYIADGLSLDLLPFLPDAPHPAKNLGPIGRDSFWLHQGLDWIRAHPGDWLHGLGVKFVAFWSWDLNPTTRGDSGLKDTLYKLSFLPLLVLSLLAVPGLRDGARRRKLLFLALPLFLFTVVHMLIFGYTRLRVPIDLLLMVLAGLTLVDTARLLGGRRAAASPAGAEPALDSGGGGSG